VKQDEIAFGVWKVLQHSLMMLQLAALSPATAFLLGGAPMLRARSQLGRTTALQLNLFNATLLVEDAVKAATGNQDYKFGDMTRGVVKELSGKEAEDYRFGDISKRLAAQAAGKEDPDDYVFGDISRRLGSEATQGLAALAGKDAEEYQFGDLTRRVLTDADRAVADARDRYFEELPTALWKQVFGGLSKSQRRDLVISLVQLAATALLCLSAVSNFVLSVSLSCAWATACARSGLSPLTSSLEWSRFMSIHATLRMFTDPPLFPLRMLATLLLTPTYRRATSGLQRILPMRERQPVLNRALSYAVAWLVINVLGGAAVTGCGVVAASLATGVPVFAPRLP
jgi:hypothetical protein